MKNLLLPLLVILSATPALATEPQAEKDDKIYDTYGNYVGKVQAPPSPGGERIITDKYGNRVGKVRSEDGGRTQTIYDNYGNRKMNIRQ